MDCTKAQKSGGFYVIDDINQVRQGRTLVVSAGEDCNASQQKEHLEDRRLADISCVLGDRCDQM